MRKIRKPQKPLADVNVGEREADGTRKVVACFWPNLGKLRDGTSTRAILAIDGSSSMQMEYGFGQILVAQPVNYVQQAARRLGRILGITSGANEVLMFYWALGDGSDTSRIGQFDAAGCENVEISGPRENQWGTGTRLLNALKVCIESDYSTSDRTIAIIITDGVFEDEKACVEYCLGIGYKINDGNHKPVNFYLLGVGNNVDKEQLQRLDDMFIGTDLDGKIDLFSHGLFNSLADVDDELVTAAIYAELMTEDIMVGPACRILSGDGGKASEVLCDFSGGLPGKIEFRLPDGARSFTVDSGSVRATQDVSEVIDS